MRELLIAGTPVDEIIMEMASEADPIKAGILALDMDDIQQNSKASVKKRLERKRKLLELKQYA